MIREGLCRLLEAEGNIEIVGQGKTGLDAVEMYRALRPDVTVMDIAMPLLTGIQAAREILKKHPLARILMLSAHDDPAYIEEIVLMGVVGYLVKQSSAELLVKAILKINQGETFYSPAISKYLREQYLAPSGKKGLAKSNQDLLTFHEVELLQLMAEGLANKRIATELKIDGKTLAQSRQSLMKKLNIREIAGLARFARAAEVGVRIRLPIKPTPSSLGYIEPKF